MFGKAKIKIASWFIRRSVDKLLRKADVEPRSRQRVLNAVKESVQNMMKNKSPKQEPVMYGGLIAVAVALAGAFGLELTNEQLAITVSTVIAIVSWIQRRLVTPTHKEK